MSVLRSFWNAIRKPFAAKSAPKKRAPRSPKSKEDMVSMSIMRELLAAKDKHIADLQQQVAYQQSLIAYLSDTKFLKPELPKQPERKPEDYRPSFSATDMIDQPVFDEDADVEFARSQNKLAAELDREFNDLLNEHQEWKQEHLPSSP